MLFAISAFLLWGLTPLYFKALGDLSAREIVAHRFVWSAVFMLAVVTLGRQWPAAARAFRDRRVMAILFATALLIGLNWSIFIYAITIDRIVSSSLGYFLNPLASVLLGALFLRERLSPLQWVAVALAAAGVAVQLAVHGALPWIALVIAVTFSVYGLLRKTVNAGAAVGLFAETVMLAPVGLAILVAMELAGTGAFGHHGPGFDALLTFAGVVTGLPLVLFAAGARRIRLATIGLIQYIAPSANLVIAVAIFGEPFGPAELATFGLIWAALALYSREVWRTRAV